MSMHTQTNMGLLQRTPWTLRDLGLLSLGRRRLRGDLRAAAGAWSGCERAGEGL